MRNVFKIAAVSLAFGTMMTIGAPAVKACPDPPVQIDINYYDANKCWQGEHLVDCFCGATNYGTTSGAMYKHLENWDCEGTGSSDIWYQWSGTQWVPISGDPGVGNC